MTSAASGLIIVDKPQGWTSHDVVGRMRRLAGTRKIGHAGTLDPMATGVLVLGVNKATRLLQFIVGTSKTYTATIRLGQTTITDDAEGELTGSHDTAAVSDDEVMAAVGTLTGDLEQVPSSVSAIKVNGQRSYARVRAGEDVQLAARPVTVSRFEVSGLSRHSVDGLQVLDIEATIDCSSGTYIRALARDLGRALNVGGHLTRLRRTQVGPYGADGARTLDELAEHLQLLDLSAAARALLPARELSDGEARELSFGRRIRAAGYPAAAAAFAPDGSLVAVLEEKDDDARPTLVFAPDTGSGTSTQDQNPPGAESGSKA